MCSDMFNISDIVKVSICDALYMIMQILESFITSCFISIVWDDVLFTY